MECSSMINMNATVKIEVTESDNHEHRYVLKKVWDVKKPMATVITLYPGKADLIVSDTTQMLVTNQLYTKGFGGFFSVNLYSKIGIADSMNKNFKQASNNENDKLILECAKESRQIIFAWGSLPQKNRIVKERVEKLIEKLNKEKKKCFILSDEQSSKYYHPLTGKVRIKWNLLPFRDE